jgi:hypothetical protein
MVMVEEPLPVIEVGLKLTVTPLGWPLALNTTAVLNPPVTVLVMLEVPDAPCLTETVEGLAERLKPDVVPPPASAVTRAGPMGLPIPVVRSYPTAEPKLLPPLVMSWKVVA